LLGTLSETISSQALWDREGSTTIPQGSTLKRVEAQGIPLGWRYGLICKATCSSRKTGLVVAHQFENNVVAGEVNTFMGFMIKRTERIAVDSNSDDKVLYWQKSGMKLAVGAEPTVKISERADKNYATQVFTSMSIGATRMQEELVGYIECHPS
tara:strand:+ start:319 stop:780 length:462 start_codon:yes stop_codon:yes gene_type:complete